jgi:hypothetical protein
VAVAHEAAAPFRSSRGDIGGDVAATAVVNALVHSALFERKVRGQAQDLAGCAMHVVR